MWRGIWGSDFCCLQVRAPRSNFHSLIYSLCYLWRLAYKICKTVYTRNRRHHGTFPNYTIIKQLKMYWLLCSLFRRTKIRAPPPIYPPISISTSSATCIKTIRINKHTYIYIYSFDCKYEYNIAVIIHCRNRIHSWN